VRFLERQESARRRTRIYILQFVLLAIPCIASTFLVMMFVIGPLVNSVLVGPFLSDSDAGDLITNVVFATVTSAAYTIGLLVFMIVIKRHHLRQSGSYVAGKLLATRAARNSSDPNTRRLHNIAEEMALAAGIPAPSVYVWPDPEIVNSLTVGHNDADAAIFVSSGAVEVLDRDEMQALVGHGMSQILNGDMALNIRLASYLHAFNFAPRVARFFLTSYDHDTGIERFKAFLAWLFFMVWIGIAIWIISMPQFFAARILQASVSRERQKLADASALQFTRNPGGVKGVLLKSLALGTVPTEGGAIFDDLAHGCFADTAHRSFLRTHPPLAERIRLVDPKFRQSEVGEAREQTARLRERAAAQRQEQAQREIARRQRQEDLKHFTRDATVAAVALATVATGATRAAATSVNDAAATATLTPLGAIDDARTTVLALLLDRKPATARRQVEALGKLFDVKSLATLDARRTAAPAGSPAERSLELDRCLADLRECAPGELRRIFAAVAEIEAFDDSVEIFEYALARHVRVFLADLLDPREPHGHHDLAHRSGAVQVLFSVVAHRGANINAAAAYDVGVQRLGLSPWPKYSPPIRWVAPLDGALVELDSLKPIAKEMLIEALEATVKFDRHVTPAERELMRVIAAVLHCPMPRLPPPASRSL
jgi:Zn-dependent protease with chaperone function